MLKRNAPAGEILRKAAPGREIELVGFLKLAEIGVQPRSLCQQFENAPLIEHVHMILPDHVVDRRQPLAVPDQHGSQTCQPISHEVAALSGTGSASATPDRNTGCGNPSGATFTAVPCNREPEIRTEPSETMRLSFFAAPHPSGLSTRPPRIVIEYQ